MADGSAPTPETQPAGLNEASYSLCLALALLEVLHDRYERHADQLHTLFGGTKHADANALFAITDLVEKAKRIVDGRP